MNHNLGIRREHLERWARLPLRHRGRVRILGEELPLLAGSVWVHPNRPGTTDLSDGQPIQLEMPEGLIVYPEGVFNPARLPIIGLRALVHNHLTLMMDGKRCDITLKTTGWF
jgi:hypothetical protein